MNTETKIISGIGIVTLVILVVGVFLLSRTPQTTANEPRQLSDNEKQYLVREDSHQTNKDAKLMVVEFADFQCPACASVHPAVTQIRQEYSDKINFVFRHMPLSDIHKNAVNAAIASEAASQQGKFWEMYDQLFNAQSVWSDKDNPISDFEKLAENSGVDLVKFKSDYDAKIKESKIDSDYSDAVSLGVNSTPTFIINNKVYPGSLSYEDLKRIIDSELELLPAG